MMGWSANGYHYCMCFMCLMRDSITSYVRKSDDVIINCKNLNVPVQ